MTESEWLACFSPKKMLVYLGKNHKVHRTRTGKRKLRLFVCACCRRLWELLEERSRLAVETAEAFAEGVASEKALSRVHSRARSAERAAHRTWQNSDGASAAMRNGLRLAAVAAKYASQPELRLAQVIDTAAFAVDAAWCAWDASEKEERKNQAAILYDLFGNPFSAVSLDNAWLTSTVIKMTNAIYDERRFEDLPILADALEEAGCTSVQMLSHCRATGLHARGCWVVDLLLART